MKTLSCSQLRTKLKEIKELKAEFDFELLKIKDTRNTAPALTLEQEIRGKIKEALFFARFGHLELAETIIGTKSKEELIKELEDREKSDNPEDKIYIWDYARIMIENLDFVINNEPEKITIIKLKIKDLGFEQVPTTEQIYNRAQKLGLELCPPEIGPHLRLNYQEVFKGEQAKGEYLYIITTQNLDPDIGPDLFGVFRNDDGERWLNGYWSEPDDGWRLEDEFIFARK